MTAPMGIVSWQKTALFSAGIPCPEKKAEGESIK